MLTVQEMDKDRGKPVMYAYGYVLASYIIGVK